METFNITPDCIDVPDVFWAQLLYPYTPSYTPVGTKAGVCTCLLSLDDRIQSRTPIPAAGTAEYH